MFPHCKEGETMSIRKEIHGVTLSRERIEDRFGDIREHWVLRDKHGDIILAEKKWDDMLGEMMWYSVHAFYKEGETQ